MYLHVRDVCTDKKTTFQALVIQLIRVEISACNKYNKNGYLSFHQIYSINIACPGARVLCPSSGHTYAFQIQQKGLVGLSGMAGWSSW